MMKRLMIFLFVAVLSATVSTVWSATTPYDTLQQKASRFFAQKEWASAEAMYQLMLDERPGATDVYARAIVSAGMRGMPDRQMKFMDAAVKNRVSYDSLFSAVKSVSFSIGSTDLYERFLLCSAEHLPWLRRSIDSYLMDYYAFRRNPEAMIAYSRKMIDGMPDNPSFQLTLAQAYLLADDVDNAMSTYRHIVEKWPDNYEALLYLGMENMRNVESGNYESAEYAEKYLRRAYAVKPTPYVDKMLKTLQQLLIRPEHARRN